MSSYSSFARKDIYFYNYIPKVMVNCFLFNIEKIEMKNLI